MATQMDKPTIEIIDTTSAVSGVVDILHDQPANPPSIYIDVEGINLSRDGYISIVQIYSQKNQCTYLLDVHTLRDTAFSTPGRCGSCLKDILESENIPKVFFDVRNDSDALYGQFGIHLRGIQDIQLMELATRSFSKRFVTGLSKCIEKDAPLSFSERTDWVRSKDDGKRLFAPEKGGSYEVFNQRPMPDAIIAYCSNDVQILPRLWEHYNNKLGETWRTKMLVGSSDRVKLSHSPFFNGQGRHMAEAPRGW